MTYDVLPRGKTPPSSAGIGDENPRGRKADVKYFCYTTTKQVMSGNQVAFSLLLSIPASFHCTLQSTCVCGVPCRGVPCPTGRIPMLMCHYWGPLDRPFGFSTRLNQFLFNEHHSPPPQRLKLFYYCII